MAAKRGGWMGTILDVDLTSGKISRRPSAPYTAEYIGGRALAAKLAWDELPAGVDAFDPENLIIIATGPLTGTLAPTAGRTIMTTVSPRVYPRPWYTHSTLGGWFGSELKYAGYDALVIRGRAQAPVYLDIKDGEARLVAAGGLWGQDSRQTQLALKARNGEACQVLAIGQAGENLVRFATVQHAEENAAGHSGFGAVWGSKNFKAIAVRGRGGVAVADPEGLLAEVRQQGKGNMTPCGGTLHTESERKRKRPVCSQACTNNCQTNYYGQTADGRRVAGCCIGGRIWLGEGARFLGSGYEGGWVRVPAGVNYSPAQEGDLHELFNGLGLDLYLRLIIVPWLLRCRELGLERLAGYPIDPADYDWLVGFLGDISQRRGLGAIFAEDLRRAVDTLAPELPEELVALGQAMEFAFGFPSHREGRIWDGEPLPFWVISALMYASESRDPTIGTHMSNLMLADFMIKDRELARRQFRRLSAKVWGDPETLEPRFDGKAPVTMWTQHQHLLLDSLPICDFSYPKLMRPLEDEAEWRATEDISGDLELDLRLLRAVTGVNYNREGLTRVAERAFTLERALLARFGRTRPMEEALAPHFTLPCKSDGTSIEPPGFSRLLSEYYAARGWDQQLGWPTAELLERLELGDVAEELSARRAARQPGV
ncbi:MAG: aldehyde ferredoxin oxidoreductase N-terminal domain-containing protein [Chloroflexota bacterium]